MLALSRRHLLSLGAAGLLYPRASRASPASDRKFIFVFCPGGWDTTGVFAPVFNAGIDHFAGDSLQSFGELTLVGNAARPSVSRYFQNWGSQTCVINGMQVPSVAHDVATRWTLTGASVEGLEDWASIVAGNSRAVRVLPNVHVSGPIFPGRYGDASVRVGLKGQLAGLLSGEVLLNSTLPVPPVSPQRDAMEEAWVRSRAARWAERAPAGMPARLAASEQLALERAASLVDVADSFAVADGSLYETTSVIVRALSLGVARTGVVAYGAGNNGLWDTHSGNDLQQGLFESLFAALDQLMADLDALPGESTPTLLEETTVVVLSEMGRTPLRNAAAGKDHWTWTSAMLVGSGVRGGQAVGGWTDALTGTSVDLATGKAAGAGVRLLPAHLGATILALADVDPAEFVDPTVGAAIDAVLA
jgi:hypothetical protein